MKLLVISDAPIIIDNGQKVAYAPYVREMNIWISHASSTSFICPNQWNHGLLIQPFKIQDFKVFGVTRLEFNNFSAFWRSLLAIPTQIGILRREMKKADHIHLRAPGNLTLLASLIQISLPRKRKTVKYAGNWDPCAKQPLSYRLQKKIFSNTIWSKKLFIMAYGEWPDQSANVVPFFTATYSESQAKAFHKQLEFPLKIAFVGTLSANKNPQLLIQLVKELNRNGIKTEAHFYGDGPMMETLVELASSTGHLEPLEREIENNSTGHPELVEGKVENVSSSCQLESVEGVVENTNIVSSSISTPLDVKSVENSSVSINSNNQNSQFHFHGNQPAAVVKKAYESAHFVFLASQSEGWPKVVAEAMWHGCIPIATPISCVPWMLNHHREEDKNLKWKTSRGILFHSIEQTVSEIKIMIDDPVYYEQISQKAQQWSQQYTLEKFENAIKNLLQSSSKE